MSCLPAAFSVSGSSSLIVSNREKGSSTRGLQFRNPNLKEIWGNTLDFPDQRGFASNWSNKAPNFDPVYAQGAISFPKAQKWWEKSLQPNVTEIESAQELVECLRNAGDRLVVLNFFSPGCGGCRALHPKICQLAESNPSTIFLTVNFEEHMPMCYALHVHVLPFFRFYRGADGKVCSFSCTNATIKKFKDALAKYGTERCSLAPAKGLEEKELVALASMGLISKDLVPGEKEKVRETVGAAKSASCSTVELKEGNAMVAA
ncbi:thioredoxin-like 1-2, chloroplastic [Salvia divinorum]|uniref:Thioredoxin-like 1-2, chloroplastic n=1 Tax=Salvia divinorum TaxID=28513 RepID=A0ABD1FKP9_SALDI